MKFPTAVLLVFCLFLWNCPDKSEPADLDTDGDGLFDAEEAELGTDPNLVDSDGDTYTDYDEQVEGTNPLDPDDRIYTGYWPYNPNKDDIEDPGWMGTCPGGMGCNCDEANPDVNPCTEPYSFCLHTPKADYCAPTAGHSFPRFVGIDQYGEMVDLYDYAFQGKIIALDMSTGWCAPCKELMRWFMDENDTEVFNNNWWKSDYLPIRDLFLNKEIIWITVLYETVTHEDVDLATLQFWAEAFPHEGTPVLGDTNRDLHTWLKPSGIPNVHLIAEDMTLMTYSNRGLTDAFERLLEEFQLLPEAP